MTRPLCTDNAESRSGDRSAVTIAQITRFLDDFHPRTAVGGAIAGQVRPSGPDGHRASQCCSARIGRCERRGPGTLLCLTLDCPRPHATALVTIPNLRSIVRRSAARVGRSPRLPRACALNAGETTKVQGGSLNVHGCGARRELRVSARARFARTRMLAPAATRCGPSSAGVSGCYSRRSLTVRPRPYPVSDTDHECLARFVRDSGVPDPDHTRSRRRRRGRSCRSRRPPIWVTPSFSRVMDPASRSWRRPSPGCCRPGPEP